MFNHFTYASSRPDGIFTLQSIVAGERQARELMPLVDEETELHHHGSHHPLPAENVRPASRETAGSILQVEAPVFDLPSAEAPATTPAQAAEEPVVATPWIDDPLPSGWEEATCDCVIIGVEPLPYTPPPRPTVYCLDDLPGDLEECEIGYSPRGIAGTGTASGRPRVAAGRRVPVPQVLFSGSPEFQHGSAVLYDSTTAGEDGFAPLEPLLNRLQLQLKGFRLKQPPVSGLVLHLYVGDLATPRVTLPVRGLLQHGERPLQVTIAPGAAVMFILEDPAGTWSAHAPRLELRVT